MNLDDCLRRTAATVVDQHLFGRRDQLQVEDSPFRYRECFSREGMGVCQGGQTPEAKIVGRLLPKKVQRLVRVLRGQTPRK